MLILGNGRMITRDADNPYLECGAVVIDGTKIVKAGTLSEVKAAYPDAEFLDAKGKVIMPAFINAHEHIYSAFARGLSVKGYDPKGFLDILDGIFFDHMCNEPQIPFNQNVFCLQVTLSIFLNIFFFFGRGEGIWK